MNEIKYSVENINLSLPVSSEDIVEIAIAAGVKILEIYDTDFDVRKKDDKTPVTKADIAAHNIILKGLAELTPDVPILSEESASISYEERKKWKCYWLVDPLDGTREFIKRNGEFTVNIALIVDHMPVLGVVYSPVLNITYYANMGMGAYKIEAGETKKIRVRKLHDDELLIAGSRSHAGPELEKFLAKLGEHKLVSLGSSLKSCLVAEGKADLYPRLGHTSEWDTAAAQCIVEEAGGLITDTHMQPLRYNLKKSLRNPYFFVFGDPAIDWSGYLDEKE